ncbi:hypothetical protein V1477_013046 [Vespula maculifrons]|uniref:Uncharacterized protein n=1 Tax=Vespula maculifrons TaxID=7453 RepID=A0ABD2BUT0_VESMC
MGNSRPRTTHMRHSGELNAEQGNEPQGHHDDRRTEQEERDLAARLPFGERSRIKKMTLKLMKNILFRVHPVYDSTVVQSSWYTYIENSFKMESKVNVSEI